MFDTSPPYLPQTAALSCYLLLRHPYSLQTHFHAFTPYFTERLHTLFLINFTSNPLNLATNLISQAG